MGGVVGRVNTHPPALVEGKFGLQSILPTLPHTLLSLIDYPPTPHRPHPAIHTEWDIACIRRGIQPGHGWCGTDLVFGLDQSSLTHRFPARFTTSTPPAPPVPSPPHPTPSCQSQPPPPPPPGCSITRKHPPTTLYQHRRGARVDCSRQPPAPVPTVPCRELTAIAPLPLSSRAHGASRRRRQRLIGPVTHHRTHITRLLRPGGAYK
jgi:hypothetical protein